MDYATSVEEAVKRFYATGSNDVHKWMMQAQVSAEAWAFVWQLLDPAKSSEVQFYAASTLHAKISRQWREVPENEYLPLQNKIIESMKLPYTSHMIPSKLCEALASFLTNTNRNDTEDKDRGLVDRAMEILPYNSPQTLDLLLRVLTAIPGELTKQEVNQTTKFRKNLPKCWDKTAWLLQMMFQNYDRNNCTRDQQNLYMLSLECARTWLKLGQLPLDVTARIYPYFLLAAAEFAPTREDEETDSRGWDVAQECITISVTHVELYKRPLLLWEWSKSLVSLAKQFGGTVFCEILTSLGEANSRIYSLALTEDMDESHRLTTETLIEMLIECSEHKGRYPMDETRSCIPFGFWYVLQDDLTMLDEPVASRVQNALKPIYTRIAQALLRKSTLPSSPSEAGNLEERELLRCYRQDAADTLVHCYSVLQKDLLVILGQRLSNLHIQPQKWTDVESTLHAFNALSISVGSDVDNYVGALIDLIVSHVPYGHYPDEILACACTTLGAYAEWIGEHPDPWLERVLQLVGHGLSMSPITSTPASMALKDLARECGPHLAPLAPSILETIGRTLRSIPPDSSVGSRLMYAAGKLINSMSSLEQQMGHLDATLGLCVGRLRGLLELNSQTGNVTNVQIATQVKMITVFLSGLDGTIGNTMLDGLIPIFMLIIGHSEFNKDDKVLETMHSCIERLLLSLKNPEIEAIPLMSILLTSYKTHPHPGALEVLLWIVLMLGKDPDNVATSLFADMSAHTLGGIAACRSADGNLADLCDLLEHYFHLLAQICKKNIRILLRVPVQIPEMLSCGMACLALPETARSSARFLSNAILGFSGLESESRVIQAIGQELVCLILRCVDSSYAGYSFEPQTEVLYALHRRYYEWSGQWLRLALEDANGPKATQAHKEDFLRTFLRQRCHKMELSSALKQLSLQCHGRGPVP